jgi:PAS domain S-box-containing protein
MTLRVRLDHREPRAAAVDVRSDDLDRQVRCFRTLIEHTGDALILLDRQLNVLYASVSTSRMLGVPNDLLAGRPGFDFVHPADREAIVARSLEISASPGARFSACFRVQRENGPPRWIEADVINLLADPDVAAIVSRYRDVTEAHATARAFRVARDELGRLSRAIEQTADSVLVTDCAGVIEYVNPAFEGMTGYSRLEVLGRTPRMLQSGMQPQPFYDTLWRTILAGEAFRAVVINRRKDGRLYDEDQTITPIRNDTGVITHFVSTGRDITQRRRTQEAMRRLNQQLENESTRIAGVLHDEAGQFLTAAHLQLAELGEHLPEALAGKVQGVRRTLDLVEEQLRRVSHEIHPRVVEDLGLLGAITFIADAFMRRTGLAISVMSRIERRYPLPVETLLYRLVQEGLTNISRHARATTGSVTVAGDDCAVSCSIRDNGIGFEVPAAEARVAVGLGLRLIQDRLEAVGGTLTITSAPGQGTELLARVPVEG